LAATLLCALGGWYFLINPPFTFDFADKADALDLFVFVISAIGISLLVKPATRVAYFENEERAGCETK
jgi:hypothetical protein